MQTQELSPKRQIQLEDLKNKCGSDLSSWFTWALNHAVLFDFRHFGKLAGPVFLKADPNRFYSKTLYHHLITDILQDLCSDGAIRRITGYDAGQVSETYSGELIVDPDACDKSGLTLAFKQEVRRLNPFDRDLYANADAYPILMEFRRKVDKGDNQKQGSAARSELFSALLTATTFWSTAFDCGEILETWQRRPLYNSVKDYKESYAGDATFQLHGRTWTLCSPWIPDHDAEEGSGSVEACLDRLRSRLSGQDYLIACPRQLRLGGSYLPQHVKSTFADFVAGKCNG